MRSAVDKMVSLLAILAGLVLCSLVVVTFYDVVMRYFFSAPLRGRQDIVEIGMVVSLALAAPYAWRSGSHISVDLYDSIAHKTLEKLRVFLVTVLVAGLLGLISWRAYFAAEDAALFNEATNMIFISHRPYILLIMVMAALHTLLVIVDYLFPSKETTATDSEAIGTDEKYTQ